MKKPFIQSFTDDDEHALFDAIEADDYAPGQNDLTQKRLADLQKMARNTATEVSEKISIRIAKTDLARIKAKALEQGLPYQTLIKSIIHQAVTR